MEKHGPHGNIFQTRQPIVKHCEYCHSKYLAFSGLFLLIHSVCSLVVDSFGRDSLKPITKDDDVICTTEYSKIVPLEDGEIPVMLLNNRPSANNYFNSTVLQEWTRATNVRFRFYRTKNLLGHLMSVARQDPTVTRRVSALCHMKLYQSIIEYII